MTYITFSVDETILTKAQIKAKLNNTTLDELFEQWLKDFIDENTIHK